MELDELRGLLDFLDQGVDAAGLKEATHRLLEAVERLEVEALNSVLQDLRGAIESKSVDRAGYAAIVAGCLVDRGADPAPLAQPVFTRLAEALPKGISFERACREKAGEEEEITPEIRGSVAEEMPHALPAFNALLWLPMCCISILSRSSELRRKARSHPTLLEHMEQYAPDHFLVTMLQVLDDEELLVLHPGEGKGFRLLMGGVSDNFQLHTLLADLLIGGRLLKGNPPDPKVAATAWGIGPQKTSLAAKGRWNMFQWFGLQADGALPDLRRLPADCVIWGEGVPADIEPFEGRRTILLGPPSYARSWSGSRLFDALEPTLCIIENLSRSAVDEVLGRMAQSSRPGRT